MNTRFSAAIAGGIALVLSTAALAQTSTDTKIANSGVAPSFPSLLAEARTKTPSTADSGVINTSLAAAQWYWASGDQPKALSYLNFARGRLGLAVVPADTAIRQAARAADATP